VGNKRGQITIFIIIAIVLVAAAVAVFVFKDKIIPFNVPTNLEPVYNSFLLCVEEDAGVGIDLLESQGGYIELPEFEPGSRYMPFGSQLNFLGNPIPYWYYVSGNNVQKEQVPSLNDMEEQLADFVKQKVRNCVLDNYYEQGFEINLGEPEVNVVINKDNVKVDLDMNLGIKKADESVVVKTHEVSVNSQLGSLYESARNVYDYEQENLFLEKYAVDILRLYAPVDGVEITCSPLTWGADKVFDELGSAIEENTLYLKTKGGDYSLTKKENEYFVIDKDFGADVKFLNSKKWNSGFEVAPAEGSVLIAEPVGNQEGLGVLGFCYVPYHFVYNVRYPVLVQVSDIANSEIFQFPVAVVLEGNNPREALDAIAEEYEDSEICENKNTLVKVNIYDSSLNPADAEITFECFGSTCTIGKTTAGSVVSEFPQCVNGYIIAESDGYKTARYLYSTIEEGSVEVILDKLYEKDVELKLDGKSYNGNAIISFVSDGNSETIVYPEQKKVELSEGQYEIRVYVYKNSSLILQATNYEQCMEVPQSGLGGLFGLTDQKCFDVEIPEQIISNALAGGGTEDYYILEFELKNSNVIEINADSLSTPKSIEDLQNNYVLFENKDLGVVFK